MQWLLSSLSLEWPGLFICGLYCVEREINCTHSPNDDLDYVEKLGFLWYRPNLLRHDPPCSPAECSASSQESFCSFLCDTLQLPVIRKAITNLSCKRLNSLFINLPTRRNDRLQAYNLLVSILLSACDPIVHWVTNDSRLSIGLDFASRPVIIMHVTCIMITGLEAKSKPIERPLTGYA